MVLKKILVIIILVCCHKLYAQYFDIQPFSLENDSLIIEEENVVFSEKYLTATIKVKNTINKAINLESTIKCIPLPTGGASYSDTLIPTDFRMFDNDKIINFIISYKNNYYSVVDSQKEEAYDPSYIHFSLTFNPNELKTIIIQYKNDSDKYIRIGNTHVEKSIGYIFNSKSNKKMVYYLPISDNYIFLVDFLYIQNGSYSLLNNYNRVYKNNEFLWSLEIPEKINEIYCRQIYFHPFADGSSYLFKYKAFFPDLDETLLFKFNNKNLSNELLTKTDLFTLSKKQLSILRNSFYAKYGYNFKNKELREYFEANCESQGIKYKVNPKFSESVFNEIERKNIELIKEMENIKEPINLSDLK